MNLKSQIISDEERNIFPEARDSEIIELLYKIKRIAPNYKSDSEKTRYLLNVISYVDGVINGDDIEQYVSYHEISKIAKKALHELIDDIHSELLDRYKIEKLNLQEELRRLYEEHARLSNSVISLEATKESLEVETENKKILLSELTAKLQDKKDNGLTRVENAVSEEKRKLEAENATLAKQQEELKSAIEELKSIFDTSSTAIGNLTAQDQTVIWENISVDHPIYNTNYITIAAFVKSLKMEYMSKMNCSAEECDQAFAINCPDLEAFKSILSGFTNEDVKETASVRSIIKYDHWASPGSRNALVLANMLKNMKFPKYTPKKSHIDTISLTSENVPDNINSMLRELHLRRITAEAIAKQKIAEAELQTVLGILKNVLPENYNYEQILSQYNMFENQFRTQELEGQQLK